MKRFSPILVLLMAILPGTRLSLEAFSQESGFAPLNPEFVRHQEYLKSREGTKSPIDSRFGYAPSPLQLNFENYKWSAYGSKSNPLPARLDLRDSGYVTSAKNQDIGWTCYAFAALAGIESAWLMNHWGSFDLSEQNLIACHGMNSMYNAGGDGNFCSAYITRLSGPVLEADDPYNPPKIEHEINANICQGTKFSVPRYVLSTRFLPPDHELIKRTIMQYGGVCTSMKSRNETNYGNDNEVYNPVDYTWFYSGNTITWEHGVLLVGWDDNKIITGGTLSPKGTKGAWIAKNSWGSWGDNGYFYLSYYDKGALSQNYHFDEFADTSELEKINMYDEFGATRTFGYGQEVAWGMTRYNASEKEKISKVGTYIASAGSTVDIYIYDDFINEELSRLIYSKTDIYCEFPGQRVFNVAAEVEGDYYVVIKYSTPGSDSPIPVEAYVKNSGFLPPELMAPGTNWVSSDGFNWDSIGAGIPEREMDLTIRTYTAKNHKVYGSFELSEQELCISDSLSVAAELMDSSIHCAWQFLPDGSTLTDTGAVPAKIHFATPGKKEVILILSDINGADTISRDLEVVNSLSFEISSSFSSTNGYVFGGWNLPYEAVAEVNMPIVLSVGLKADSFRWCSPYESINAAEISVIPDHTGKNIFYASLYKGACSGVDTITVEGFLRPINDDVKNAIELHEGVNGPYSNYFATVEENEPCPPFSEVKLDGYWFPDGGLQNSVWFWFNATRNDSVKLFADGLYDQIAIYQAESAEDLLTGNYSLITATDNLLPILRPGGAGGTYFQRTILNELITGKKYWVQFDGGYNGANDIFKIGIHNPRYFYTSADTLVLDADSNSIAVLTVRADSSWLAVRGPNCSWIGFTPTKGIGLDTIVINAKSTNNTGLNRAGLLTLKSAPYFEEKKIVIVQSFETAIENKSDSRVILYPNPVSDALFIKGLEGMQTTSMKYVVHDVAGRIVLTAECEPEKRISVAYLTKGLYFLEIRQGRQVVATGKFIKE
jgi:C1A family cysteine protease